MTVLRFAVPAGGGALTVHRGEDAGGSLGPVALRLDGGRMRELLARRDDIAERMPHWTDLRGSCEEIGSCLFQTLIGSADVEALYRQSLRTVRASRRDGDLSSILHLSLELADASLNNLPWELMFDPKEQAFCGSSNHISISRAVAGCSSVRCRRPPLRLLVVVATPVEAWLPEGSRSSIRQELACLDTLELFRSLKRIEEGCGPDLARFTFLTGPEATPERLRRELERSCDVLYFIGHSYVRQGTSFFLLEDGTRLRRGVRLSGMELGQWLQSCGVRIVILSSCDSLAAATGLGRLEHLEGVVGMQMQMPMITAEAFDKAVLESLAAGLPLDRCILGGRARIQRVLRDAVQDEAAWDCVNRPDWAVPVLLTNLPARGFHLASVCAGAHPVGIDESTAGTIARQLGISRISEGLLAWLGRPREVELSAFAIWRWPVTNHEYRYFLEHGPFTETLPPGFERQGGEVRLAGTDPGAPVVGVTWEEAAGFCRWLGGRLPTADEWEVAARGPAALVFPWGNGFDPDRCSAFGGRSARPEAVFLREQGASPFGVEDLCGNVFEWTATELVDQQGRRRRAVAGGSWRAPALLALPSLRCPRDPARRYDDVGFRCVL